MRDHTQTKSSWWAMLDEDGEETGLPNIRPVKRSQERLQERAVLVEELYQEEAGFNFTYHASRHEQQWLSTSLREFYADSLINDVLSMVKGGKEANVYCCQGHPNIGLKLLAAKVYRPALLRNLKNDAIYKEGRFLLGDDGKQMRGGREYRAMAKKTRVGRELSITSWIEHEFLSLQVLHAAGADVPRPIAQTGNAILMEFVGEQAAPAPTLNTVTLDRQEARRLFQRLLQNVRLMLAFDRIHADLSPYNILYSEGIVKIIDFPQVVDPLLNPSGFKLLLRDVERLCQYFARYDLLLSPYVVTNDLWNSYLRGELKKAFRQNPGPEM